MARIRTLKPELLEDDRTAGLSHAAFRLFVGAILLADDHGNLRASVSYLAGAVFHGVDHEPIDVAAALIELAAPGTDLLALYEVHGQRYATIKGWIKHQRIDNAGKPRVPGPDSESAIPIGDLDAFAAIRRNSRQNAAPTSDLRPPTPTSEKDPDPDPETCTPSRAARVPVRIASAVVDAAYRAYPRKVGKTRGYRKLLADVRPDEGQDLLRAAENYAAYVRGQRTEERYQKHFSTWANEWRDWLTPPETTAVVGHGPNGNLTADDLWHRAQDMKARGE